MPPPAKLLLEPLTGLLDDGPSGHYFAQILPQILTDPALPQPALAEIIGDTAREEAYALLLPFTKKIPPVVSSERLYVAQLQVVHAIADRARVESVAESDWHLSNRRLFTNNLIDMRLRLPRL